MEGSLRRCTPLSTAVTQDPFSTCEGKPTQRCTIEWEKERHRYKTLMEKRRKDSVMPLKDQNGHWDWTKVRTKFYLCSYNNERTDIFYAYACFQRKYSLNEIDIDVFYDIYVYVYN